MKYRNIVVVVIWFMVFILKYRIDAFHESRTFETLATEWPLRIRGYERDYIQYHGGYVHGGYHQHHHYYNDHHHHGAYHNHHSIHKHGWGGRGGGTGRRGLRCPSCGGITKFFLNKATTNKDP
ncbi:hypothetical protein AgCh_039124 [Apium graveolens]